MGNACRCSVSPPIVVGMEMIERQLKALGRIGKLAAPIVQRAVKGAAML